MTQRAKKGGELGANGEWYEGGKFINTIPENSKKEGSAPARAHKVNIEPYVWVVSDKRPIFSIVGAGAAYIDRNNPSKGIEPYMPAFKNGIMYTGETLENIQELCNRYNAGERFR